jgi:hypothetical protein
MLSLDQISFYPIKNKGRENAEPLEKTERERVAWTYCYLFDRQIAIRTGEHATTLGYYISSNEALPLFQARHSGLEDPVSCSADLQQITFLRCAQCLAHKTILQASCRRMLI